MFFLGAFPCFFCPKKQGKEDQGNNFEYDGRAPECNPSCRCQNLSAPKDDVDEEELHGDLGSSSVGQAETSSSICPAICDHFMQQEEEEDPDSESRT